VTSRTIPRLLAILLLGLVWGCAASSIPPVHSEAERMALARRMMDQRRWASATELLKGYIQNNPGAGDVDQAVYLLGMCYLRTHDWALAGNEFDRMIREYPESDSTPSASFRLGEALYAQARPPDFDQEFTHKALDQWQAYLRNYPGHWLNPQAERQSLMARSRLATKLIHTGELYLKLKLPGPARVYFEQVEQEYGDTLLLGRALLGEALCDVREGNTERAIERLRDVENRFAGRAVATDAARERVRLESRRHR
jgi:outer membrane protein assembly factor BamD